MLCGARGRILRLGFSVLGLGVLVLGLGRDSLLVVWGLGSSSGACGRNSERVRDSEDNVLHAALTSGICSRAPGLAGWLVGP